MDDRGSVVLTLAVLLYGGVLMLGVAVDVARVAATWREAAHAATSAAEAGAGWIDATEALADRLTLDPQRAAVVAEAVASGADRAVTAWADRARVCVTVAIPVEPSVLKTIGAAPTTVSATACAEPRKG